MKRIFLLGLALLAFAFAGSAQHREKARQLLDRLAADYRQAACLSIQFSGSQSGSLLLQDNCFVLDCAGIKSWYDGQTQWSYVIQNDEVNISVPTADELDNVHPYAWINRYATAFTFVYAGQKTENGQQVHEVVLTPKTTGELSSITLHINAQGHPTLLRLQTANGGQQTYVVTGYQPLKRQPLTVFRFPEKQYPNAEVVDLR